MNVKELLAFSIKQSASDLHLSSVRVPMIPVDGDIRPLNQPAYSAEQLQDLLFDIMAEPQ